MILWGVHNESVFHEGFALVKSNGKWGAIDKTGQIIIQPQFDQVGDFIAELKLIKLDSKAEFTDKTGKIVIQTQLEWIQNTINTLNQVNGDMFELRELVIGGINDDWQVDEHPDAIFPSL